MTGHVLNNILHLKYEQVSVLFYILEFLIKFVFVVDLKVICLTRNVFRVIERVSSYADDQPGYLAPQFL